MDLSDQTRFPQKLKHHIEVEVRTPKPLNRLTCLREEWRLRPGSQSLQLCVGLLVSAFKPNKLGPLDVT